MLLAAVGLYGVTAYAVARRTNELGIRMALGADRTKVEHLSLRGASTRVLIGLLLGIPLAIGAGRLIAANLYGVASWDPLAASALAVCALFAALIPAGRAASISPVEALRTEQDPAHHILTPDRVPPSTTTRAKLSWGRRVN